MRWKNYIDGRIDAAVAAYHESAELRPVTRAVLKGLIAEIRSEISAEVGQLRADTQIAKAHPGDHAADVIDLPALPLRSQRRA